MPSSKSTGVHLWAEFSAARVRCLAGLIEISEVAASTGKSKALFFLSVSVTFQLSLLTQHNHTPSFLKTSAPSLPSPHSTKGLARYDRRSLLSPLCITFTPITSFSSSRLSASSPFPNLLHLETHLLAPVEPQRILPGSE